MPIFSSGAFGSNDNDFILLVVDDAFSGGAGNDVIVGDHGPFLNNPVGNISFATAYDLDTLPMSYWTTDENPLFGDDSIPHMTIYEQGEAGTIAYFEIDLQAGQAITVDIDFAYTFVGSETSTGVFVQLYDAGFNLVASGTSANPEETGGEGSLGWYLAPHLGFDSYLQHDVGATGTYYIVVRETPIEYEEFESEQFEGDEDFLINISVTGHAVGAPTVMGDDVIHGGDGADRIYGVSGDDEIYGDEGGDTIFGGSGNDRIYGGGTVATPFGNIIYGGLGNDLIEGGSGDDELWGESGEDSLFGKSGDDTLYAGSRADEIFGGSGDDVIYSGSGNDRANGGSGNDVIIGGSGNDLVFGGPGNDNISGNAGDDTLNGGTGTDTMNFSLAEMGVSWDMFSPYATGDGNDYLTGFENIIGSAHDDTFTGNNLDNFIEGRGGEDSILGGSGNDTVSGGSRADEIFGGVGVDLLMGDAGNDRINGGSGPDTLLGGGDNDLLIGGPGADTLNGGTGNDTLAGGSNDDLFVFEANSGDDTVLGFVPGGTVDELDFSALGIGYGDLTIAAQGGDTLITTPGGDTVLLVGVTPGQLDPMTDFIF